MIKKLISLFVFVSFVLLADTYVQPYFKSDGTYVQGHYRSDPDQYKFNNRSYNWNNNSTIDYNSTYQNTTDYNYNNNTYKQKTKGTTLYGY